MIEKKVSIILVLTLLAIQAVVAQNLCAGVSPADQCSYFQGPSASLPPFVRDTIEAFNGTPAECSYVLVISSGDPNEQSDTLDTGYFNPGCGLNPDNFSTCDCITMDFTPPVPSTVLAISSEWIEWLNSDFTDWMRVAGQYDISITDWDERDMDVKILDYDPAESGAVSLINDLSQTTELRVADSGDCALDTALIMVPTSCVEVTETVICGDGIIQTQLGEECDNGENNSDTVPNACRTNCKLPSCGDDVIDSGEACDDGNNDNGDGCDENCLIEELPEPACGDGNLDEGEVCDDGNTDDGDGCSSNCTLEEKPAPGESCNLICQETGFDFGICFEEEIPQVPEFNWFGIGIIAILVAGMFIIIQQKEIKKTNKDKLFAVLSILIVLTGIYVIKDMTGLAVVDPSNLTHVPAGDEFCLTGLCYGGNCTDAEPYLIESHMYVDELGGNQVYYACCDDTDDCVDADGSCVNMDSDSDFYCYDIFNRNVCGGINWTTDLCYGESSYCSGICQATVVISSCQGSNECVEEGSTFAPDGNDQLCDDGTGWFVDSSEKPGVYCRQETECFDADTIIEANFTCGSNVDDGHVLWEGGDCNYIKEQSLTDCGSGELCEDGACVIEGCPVLQVDTDSYWKITDCCQLDLIGTDGYELSDNYKLTRNLDCQEEEHKIEGDFSGMIDGKGYYITNLKSTKTLIDGALRGTVKNLGIINSTINLTGFSTGGFGGMLSPGCTGNGMTDRVFVASSEIIVGKGPNVDGEPWQPSVGAIIGANGCELINTYSKNNLISGTIVGGIAGWNQYGNITDSYTRNNELDGYRDYEAGIVVQNDNPFGSNGHITDTYSDITNKNNTGSQVQQTYFSGNFNNALGVSHDTTDFNMSGYTLEELGNWSRSAWCEGTKGYPILLYNGQVMQGQDDVCESLCNTTIVGNTVLTNDQDCTEEGIIIGADNITLDCDGHIIEGTGINIGIWAIGRKNITIKNCIVKNFWSGITFTTTIDSYLLNNTALNNKRGIELRSSSTNNLIEENKVRNSSEMGVQFFSLSTGNRLIDNLIEFNPSMGVFLGAGTGNQLIHNNIIRNNSNHAIQVFQANDNIITNNILNYNREGVNTFLTNTHRNNIMHNTIIGSSSRGISLVGRNNTIDNNTIEGTQGGSAIELRNGVRNNSITNNRIQNNFNSGMQIGDGTENRVANNIIQTNSIFGFRIIRGYENIVEDNIITANPVGLVLKDTHLNQIIDNNISLNTAGIELQNASNNSIVNNLLYLNHNYGLLITSQGPFLNGNSTNNNITLNDIKTWGDTIRLNQDADLIAEDNNFSVYTATEIANTITDNYDSAAYDGMVDFCPYLNEALVSEGGPVVVSSVIGFNRYFACCDDDTYCANENSECVASGTIEGNNTCTNGTWISPTCDNDGECEVDENCECLDCLGKNDGCDTGKICSINESCCDPLTDPACGCPPGMNWCPDTNECYNPLTEICDFNQTTDCGDNETCEVGDSCSCPECHGQRDTCAPTTVCDKDKEACVCPIGTGYCNDGTCSEDCVATDDGWNCKDELCINGAVCDENNEKCVCPEGTVWDETELMCEEEQVPAGGGGRGRGRCRSKWVCTEWSDCNPPVAGTEGYRIRECEDTRECEFPTDVPVVLESCETSVCENSIWDIGIEEGPNCGGPCEPCPETPIEQIEEEPAPIPPEIIEEPFPWLLVLIIAIIALLIIGGSVYGYEAYEKKHKRLAALMKRTDLLRKAVHNVMTRGFAKEEVSEALKRKGWPSTIISKVMEGQKESSQPPKKL